MKLGINGSGFFENLDDFSKAMIKDNFSELYIRVPGGSISRFHEPFSVRRGWGLTAEKVNYFFDNYNVGADEDDPNGGRDKWLQKVNEQPNYSYLDSLITLSNEMPGLRVIYVINVFTSTAEEQLNALNYLISNGVRVDVVEFGNEVYGKYEFDTTAYITYCYPIINAIKESHPNVKVSLISGNFKGRRDHEQWNTQLASYVNIPENKVDYVTLHFYIGNDLAPNAYNLLPAPKVVDYSQFDSQIGAACDSYAEEVIYSERFAEEIAMAKEIYNVPIIVTEYNNNPASAWCNTYINAAWIFYNSLTLQNVDILCLHNGVSPDIYGMICRKKQQDDFANEMVPRVSFFALALADIVKKNSDAVHVDSLDFSSAKTGRYMFIQVDTQSGYTFSQPIIAGDREINYTTYTLGGKYAYSSSGATGFQAKNQPKNMEITGITTTTGSGSGTITWEYPKMAVVIIDVVEPEIKPIAYAGEDTTYTIAKGQLTVPVTLDASGSFSSSIIARYEWEVPNYGTYNAVNITTPTVVHMAAGKYLCTLKVYNASGDMSSDTVLITVKKKKGFFGNILNLKDGTVKISSAQTNL